MWMRLQNYSSYWRTMPATVPEGPLPLATGCPWRWRGRTRAARRAIDLAARGPVSRHEAGAFFMPTELLTRAAKTGEHGLDRLELIRFLPVAQTISVHHGALAYLLGINALRASEAAAVRVEDYAQTMRGHRVLHLVGKGGKPATMPLTVPVLRVLEACRGDRITGPRILRPTSDKPIDRRDAYRMVARVAKAAGIPRHISPHSLRHAAITNALDAGVPLRDAQILARHADPRTTEHYDRARGNLDRHRVHFLTGEYCREHPHATPYGRWGAYCVGSTRGCDLKAAVVRETSSTVVCLGFGRRPSPQRRPPVRTSGPGGPTKRPIGSRESAAYLDGSTFRT